MTQLLMDDNDDIAIVNNTFVLTENNSDEEIRQRLIQKLKTFLGEWFLDSTDGLPYHQAIFIKGTSPDIIDAAFKDAIIETEGVEILNRFDSIEFDSGTRVAKLKFDVATINSETLTIEIEV